MKSKKTLKLDYGKNLNPLNENKNANSNLENQNDITSSQNDIGDNNNSKISNNNSNNKKGIRPFDLDLDFSTNNLFAGITSFISGLLPNTPIDNNQNKTLLNYNPNSYGNNTQAIAESGLEIKSNPKNIFSKFLKAHGFNKSDLQNSLQKMQFENGGTLTNDDYDEMDFYAANGITMLENGNISPLGGNAYSKHMNWITGPSHEEGGVKFNVNGQTVEAQGGEGLQQYSDGSTVIFGKMKFPNLGKESKGLHGKTFQSIAKEIGKEEEKNLKKYAIPASKTENLDPSNKYESLTLGSKEAQQIGYNMRSLALSEQKNHLKNIQSGLQKIADMQNIPYEKAHSIFAENGANVNKKYKRTEDDGNLNNLDKPEGIENQPLIVTNINETGPIPEESEANNLLNNKKNSESQSKSKSKKMPSLTDQNKIGFKDILSEMSYLAKRPQPVQLQQYRPYLQDPYQVSFQERRNQNQASFNEIAKQLQGSGSVTALAALAGQKYEADNAVNAEEFRANQSIFNQTLSKNYDILNEADRFNLGLKDQQFVRQSQALSNTEAQRAQALASISNKINAKDYENMNLRMIESRSGYRYNPVTKTFEWNGPDAPINFGNGISPQNNVKVTKHYDKDGNLTGRDEVDNPEFDDDYKKARLQKAQRAAYSKFGNIFK